MEKSYDKDFKNEKFNYLKCEIERVRSECDILKKLWPSSIKTTQVFSFIDEHRTQWTVKGMCRVLSVSRSGFYKWHSRFE